METSDKTKKLQLLGGFATKKQLEEQYIKTYVLDEGETIEDAPEWAEEVVDPFSESEGGDGSGTVEEKALILPSSTEGSTKRFKITVDDTGTLTATEVTT